MNARILRPWLILLSTTLLCWAWIVAMARDMYGPMTGASAWMMRTSWDLPHLLLLWAMWAVMMAAMMLPSALPMLMLLRRRQASGHVQGGSESHLYGLAAGYLASWSVFSIAATLLQWTLGTLRWLTPMMEPAGAGVAGAMLLLAGIYQFTPLKHACLRTCRSPLSFLMSRWRPGAIGAMRMGWEHGLYCIGCCWALMLLLFAGGVMSLMVIVALTAWVILEKTTPFGEFAARTSGALLIIAGLWSFF